MAWEPGRPECQLCLCFWLAEWLWVAEPLGLGLTCKMVRTTNLFQGPREGGPSPEAQDAALWVVVVAAVQTPWPPGGTVASEMSQKVIGCAVQDRLRAFLVDSLSLCTLLAGGPTQAWLGSGTWPWQGHQLQPYLLHLLGACCMPSPLHTSQ